MNPRTLTFALVGLAVAIGLVAAGLFFSRGARIILQGKIQKVRIQAIDENSTAILVDFRAREQIVDRADVVPIHDA